MTLEQYLSKTNETETAFSARVQVSQATVNRWISGERSPSKKAILRIEEATKGKVKRSVWFDEAAV